MAEKMVTRNGKPIEESEFDSPDLDRDSVWVMGHSTASSLQGGQQTWRGTPRRGKHSRNQTFNGVRVK